MNNDNSNNNNNNNDDEYVNLMMSRPYKANQMMMMIGHLQPLLCTW